MDLKPSAKALVPFYILLIGKKYNNMDFANRLQAGDSKTFDQINKKGVN
jgi:hypothetical protein